jgi:hypothetical protein
MRARISDTSIPLARHFAADQRLRLSVGGARVERTSIASITLFESRSHDACAALVHSQRFDLRSGDCRCRRHGMAPLRDPEHGKPASTCRPQFSAGMTDIQRAVQGGAFSLMTIGRISHCASLFPILRMIPPPHSWPRNGRLPASSTSGSHLISLRRHELRADKLSRLGKDNVVARISH